MHIQNIAHLAKRIIAFVSNDEKVEMKLKELKGWLKDFNYPDSVINQSLYNAKLHGPVPFTDNLKNIPFVTTHYENIDNKKVVRCFFVKFCKFLRISFFYRATPVVASRRGL